MPSLSAINRANYQREVDRFPKILRDRLLALLILMAIPYCLMELYYEGDDKIYKRWSWYQLAFHYFIQSFQSYLQVPLILDSISWLLWQGGLRSPVVMIRTLTMGVMANLWLCFHDVNDSIFPSYHLTWGWARLSTYTLIYLGVPMDAFQYEKLVQKEGTKRGYFEGLFMLISLILLVWNSAREIRLFRRLKLYERIFDAWSYSSLKRKLENWFTKVNKFTRSLSGKMSEKLFNWWNNINPKRAFLEACEKGNKVEMRALLSEHEDSLNVNLVRSSNGDTGLHLACRAGHTIIAESLLDVKKKVVNVNIENAAGETPLMVAAGAGHLAIVRRLLKAKGLKLKEYGEKALLEAVRNGQYDAAKLILDSVVKKEGVLDENKLQNMQEKLECCLQISKRMNDSNTNQDMQQCKLSLDLYKKSICEMISPSEVARSTTASKQKPLRESIKDLKEFLECSICFDEFEDLKIFACVNDHWICMRCLPQNESCPFCRVDFALYPPARRITSEKILQILKDTQCDMN